MAGFEVITEGEGLQGGGFQPLFKIFGTADQGWVIIHELSKISFKTVSVYEGRGSHEWGAPQSAFKPQLDYLRTQKLIHKARKLGISVPKLPSWFTDQYNVYSEHTYKVLTEFGEAKVRNLIRKQRREDMEWWLKVIGALTGLIGVLIGLVAILK